MHVDTDEAGEDVLTIEGTAAVDPDTPPSDRLEEYQVKYREGIRAIGMTPDQLARDYSVAVRIRPTHARAW